MPIFIKHNAQLHCVQMLYQISPKSDSKMYKVDAEIRLHR